MHIRRRSLIFFMLVFLAALPPVASAQARISEYQYIQIADAYYADLDGDLYQDDIKLLFSCCFGEVNPTRVDLNIWIELPSGLTYSVRISIYNTPSQFLLNVDCFNMATESGLYAVTLLASVMGAGSGKLYIIDEIIFDPPTGGGPGLPPTVVAYI